MSLRPRTSTDTTPLPAGSHRKDRLGQVCGAAFIVLWFLTFAGSGVGAPFSGDDLMNLHGHLGRGGANLLLDNLCFWSTAYRPMGGLFYVGLYKLFGFDPLPFRLACFALLLLNLWLLYRFCHLLTRSRSAAFLATFLAAYHAWFVDLYRSSGTVYELLSYAFYFAAFDWYLSIRQAGGTPGLRQIGGICLLYVAALNAKEMAVTLPLFLLCYEAIFHVPWRQWRPAVGWWRVNGRTILSTGVLTAIYVAGKVGGDGSLADQAAYKLTISAGRYLDSFHLYLNPLLYQEHLFRDPNTIQLLLAMLAVALLFRSRAMMLAWCILLLALLPVAFIAHYSGFFLYFPMAGWALYAALLVDIPRRALLRRVAPAASVDVWNAVSLVVTTGLLAAMLAPLHTRESVKTTALFSSALPPVDTTRAQLLQLQPQMKREARVLFLNDPFPSHDYFLLFLTRLLYNDLTIHVERSNAPPRDNNGIRSYDAVFEYVNGRMLKREAP